MTHWSGGFSKDGKCSDEYTNSKGGVGISLETGQCGFDPEQASFASNKLTQLMKKLNHSDFSFKQLNEIKNDFYTWQHVEPYPKNQVELVEGLSNFELVNKGQELGLINGESYKCSESGMLMFPKYVSAGQKPPAEIYRIAKKIEASELP